MRIHIQGRPEFRFTLTWEQIDVLRKLSTYHYDASCRAAANPNAPYGANFLHTWWACMNGYGLEYQHRATWRQLDTTLKIMEMTTGCTEGERNTVRGLAGAFNRAMNTARECMSAWTATATHEV